jgi:hypothetical protein
LLCLSLLASGQAEAASSYVDFDSYPYKARFAGAKKGVGVAGTVKLTPAGREAGRGSLTSPVYRTATRFDTLVPSWNAATPSGTWIQTEVRVRSGGNWTRWFNMGVWSKSTPSKRHSVNGQSSGSWSVSTDTLQSRGPVFADAYQYRLTLFTSKRSVSPTVTGLSFTASNSYRHGEFLGVAGSSSYWGKDLPVPMRSQMIYPGGGEVWCSPTSLSMVMTYWSSKTGNRSLNQSVPTVARGTYDPAYRGWGNWPFNTAYASSFGLKASVNRFSSLGQAERWVAKGVPVIASIAWNNNSANQRLTGAPIPASNGHLLVIRGFDKTGEYVIVNDPAASDDSGVRRVYRRDEFARAWFETGSGGVAYLVHPRAWTVPGTAEAQGSW